MTIEEILDTLRQVSEANNVAVVLRDEVIEDGYPSFIVNFDLRESPLKYLVDYNAHQTVKKIIINPTTEQVEEEKRLIQEKQDKEYKLCSPDNHTSSVWSEVINSPVEPKSPFEIFANTSNIQIIEPTQKDINKFAASQKAFNE